MVMAISLRCKKIPHSGESNLKRGNSNRYKMHKTSLFKTLFSGTQILRAMDRRFSAKLMQLIQMYGEETNKLVFVPLASLNFL